MTIKLRKKAEICLISMKKWEGWTLKKKGFIFSFKLMRKSQLISLEVEEHWGYFWEQHQKKIEKEGVGNGWEDVKENEVWGVME